MKIDTGLMVVLVAALIFYLRLIGMQRERARIAARLLAQPPQKPRKGKSAPKAAPPRPDYSILSRSPVDRIIAGVGLAAILVGAALNAGWLAFQPLQPYWWLPTALGIVAFSWAFKITPAAHGS